MGHISYLHNHLHTLATANETNSLHRLKDIVNIATAFKNCCYILNNLLNKMGVYDSYGFP